MSDTKEVISLLVELQGKDSVLQKLRKQLEENPVSIENFKKEKDAFHSDAEEAKKRVLDMQKLKKEEEIDLETREEKIKKNNLDLNSVRSNEAYKALLTEIDSAKSEKSKFEDEILDLMEKIDQELARSKTVEKEIKEKDAVIQSKIATIEEDSKKVQSEIEKLQVERDEFAKKIPGDILSKYDYIRESRDGLAIVCLDGENCGGCSTVLRPQTINEIFKGKDLIICDTCSRIIYKKNGT